MSKPLWKWNCDTLWMFLLPDTVQATALHRDASESGRASPKVHEGASSEGYMGKKDNNSKEIRRDERKWGCVCVCKTANQTNKKQHTHKNLINKKKPQNSRKRSQWLFFLITNNSLLCHFSALFIFPWGYPPALSFYINAAEGLSFYTDDTLLLLIEP